MSSISAVYKGYENTTFHVAVTLRTIVMRLQQHLIVCVLPKGFVRFTVYISFTLVLVKDKGNCDPNRSLLIFQ